MVGEVARSEHPWNGGFGRAGPDLHIAAVVGFKLVLDQFACRRMTDGDEDTLRGDLGDSACLDMARAHTLDAGRIVVAHDLGNLVVPEHLDLGMPEKPLLHDLFGAQAVATVDQRHLRREVRQKQRLLDRGIASANDHDFSAAIEEPVAGRAGRHAKALELLLGRQAKPLRPCAGGKDDRVGKIDRAAVALRRKGPV